MPKEKQVTYKLGKELVSFYYPQATAKQARIITDIWNSNEGVEYDGVSYNSMEEWLYTSEYNGYTLKEMTKEAYNE